ncbi:hypothetical protein ABWI01_03350 [Oceanicaulis alexandrii]|uniref:hypothetical protein n=1 Tax=Oceanicaulis alexandrii TaxID=153233 RepID=UPI0035CECBFF
MNDLDNRAYAEALVDLVAQLVAGSITADAAKTSLKSIQDRYYTFEGEAARRMRNFQIAVEGLQFFEGPPNNAIGADGEGAIDWVNKHFYGPKLNGDWGEPVASLGGEDGSTILYGQGAPSSQLGADGDGYVDKAAGVFYGPKASGAWPAGLSLVGPPGKKVELQKSATHIQWRYEGDASWTDLAPLADLKGADGREVELGVTATHIQWRLADGDWVNLLTLSALKGADGRELEIRVSGGHIQTRLGTDDWADLFDLSQAIGPTGPQGEGLHYDVSGPFAARSGYDAEDAGFVFASTDGADGLGGVAVLYKREGASGWGDPVEIQGAKGDKGDDGDLVSLEGFVPYATIVTGSGALIPGARVSFEGTAAATLALDYETPEEGDIYAISNSGNATATLNAGPTGVFKINPASPLDAGDELAIAPGQGVELQCANPIGPVFSQFHLT